jgi:hypothetical protein
MFHLPLIYALYIFLGLLVPIAYFSWRASWLDHETYIYQRHNLHEQQIVPQGFFDRVVQTMLYVVAGLFYAIVVAFIVDALLGTTLLCYTAIVVEVGYLVLCIRYAQQINLYRRILSERTPYRAV